MAQLVAKLLYRHFLLSVCSKRLIIMLIIFSVSCLVYKMSDNGDTCRSVFPKTQDCVLKCLERYSEERNQKMSRISTFTSQNITINKQSKSKKLTCPFVVLFHIQLLLYQKLIVSKMFPIYVETSPWRTCTIRFDVSRRQVGEVSSETSGTITPASEAMAGAFVEEYEAEGKVAGAGEVVEEVCSSGRFKRLRSFYIFCL